MAIQTKLGRVQGASLFTTTAQAYSEADYQYVSRSDLNPSPETGIKPMVGDCIIFANGVVGTVANVQSSSTIGCKTNLFSLKGKDGLNITKVEQTTTSTQSGGINVVTFTLSDGSTHNIQVQNGKEGGSGVDGLVVKNENDQNKLYLTKEGQTVGDGITFPEGNGGAGGTNYIANSNFAINQRGKQTYDEQGTGRVYTLDRWAKNSETGNLVAEKIEGETGGNVVPNDGTFVENIYLNTALGVDQVKLILNQITDWFDIMEDGTQFAYYVATTEDMSGVLAVLKAEGEFFILCMTTDENGDLAQTVLWQSAPLMGENIGWVGIDSYPFNGNTTNGTSIEAPFVIGAENDKLANLFSTTISFGGESCKVEISGTITGKGEVFVQPVEGALLAGQTVAFSMQLPALSGECLVGVVCKQGDTQTKNCVVAKQGLNFVSCTIPANATQVVCGLFYNGENQMEFSAKIEWAKLEVGKKATQYLPPLPASDMAECQRYFQKADYNGAVGFAKSANELGVTLPLPTTMRKTPAVNDTAKLYINNGHSLATPTVTKAGNNCVSLSFATQNLIAGNFYQLNDYVGYLDAEIYEDE